MKIIGVTGSTGMGKTTVARLLAGSSARHFDADAVIRTLRRRDPATIAALTRAFPAFVMRGVVQERALAAHVLADPDSHLRTLQDIYYPPLRRRMEDFLRRHRARGATHVVLDIPLLFETGLAARCDQIVVASAPAALQHQRLRRRGLTTAEINALLARQWSDAEKRAHADFIVPTGLGLRYSRDRIRTYLKKHFCRETDHA